MTAHLELRDASGATIHRAPYTTTLAANRSKRVIDSQIAGGSHRLLVIGERGGDGYHVLRRSITQAVVISDADDTPTDRYSAPAARDVRALAACDSQE